MKRSPTTILVVGLFQLIRNKEFQVLLILTGVMLVSRTSFYLTVEGFSVVDALYFSIAILTTVGSATLETATDFSKTFTIFYTITDIGVTLSLILQLFVQMRNKKK